MKPKVSRRKEIIKIRAEINEIESKQKNNRKENATKSWFFEVSKTDKPLARLTKEKRERTQSKSGMKGEITTDTAEIQRIIQEYYEKLHNTKFNNLEEMDQYLD